MDTNFVWWLVLVTLEYFNFSSIIVIPSTMEDSGAFVQLNFFSVIQAGLFPIIHMVVHGYGILPYFQFGFSLGLLLPLLWDVFAISTYLSVSLFFGGLVYYLILQC
jgi:molybdopterin-containing oxidoreductase family membrane subunit